MDNEPLFNRKVKCPNPNCGGEVEIDITQPNFDRELTCPVCGHKFTRSSSTDSNIEKIIEKSSKLRNEISKLKH